MLNCFFLLLGTKHRICDKSIQYIIGQLVDSADCGYVPEDDISIFKKVYPYGLEVIASKDEGLFAIIQEDRGDIGDRMFITSKFEHVDDGKEIEYHFVAMYS